MVMIFLKAFELVNIYLFIKQKTKHINIFLISVLVDKDNKPQWKPNSLKNLSNKDIEQYFEKPSSNEDLQL